MPVLVSVCIPVYNGAKFISETIESLLNQTMVDIEIVISDNASTDETVKIANKFLEKDSRIKLNVNKSNIGYCLNINKAVSLASAEVISIFHADDVYKPGIINRQYMLIKSGICDAAFSNMEVFYDGINRYRRARIFKSLEKTPLYDDKADIFLGNYLCYLPYICTHGNFFPCSSLMTTKKLFEEIGGFTDKYPSNEDFELWIKYLQAGKRLAIINEPMMRYRFSSTNASTYLNKIPELNPMYKVFDDLVLPIVHDIKDKTNYSKLKSIGYLRAAMNAVMIKGMNDTVKSLVKNSRSCYVWKPLSIWGFCQRYPLTFSYTWAFLKNIKYTI